ncbi:activator of Hsp90 ATPase [Radiomyces spectabilis]|uniref:activator of Hsp90 ATPase n=1 Tax=Radiomyces spectabilis TaxID=64574 RepID=UPI0022200DEB|nr:activator of Hsp90 ATPase [Radiomyces spectabilis]KAI8374283.1 activator of Hsp90 ATPase [Radiomyces spectabilis]
MSNWKNVNNWHWVSKNCLNWAQKYFDAQLVGLQAERDGNKVAITKVNECVGDVDLSQRKGKLITIYGVELKLTWEGTTANGTQATGKIHVPEVAHDTEADEYVFDVSVDNDSQEKQVLRDVVKKQLAPLMIDKFEKLATAMIKENSSDVYIEQKDKAGSGAPTVGVTKERTGVTHINKTTSNVTSTTSTEKSGSKVNTTTLQETIEFQTSAHELFETLLDPQRASVWTRGPAQVSKQVGSKFQFFNGNVSGEILEVEPDKKIVQSWRLASWPAGHYSTVTMTFNQGNDNVELTVKQTGVPIGEEELTQRNWAGYYWRAIKQSFGFGAVF